MTGFRGGFQIQNALTFPFSFGLVSEIIPNNQVSGFDESNTGELLSLSIKCRKNKCQLL